MRFEHKKLGAILTLKEADDLLARDVDVYLREYRKLPMGDNAVQVVKAAVIAGWIIEPILTAEAVDSMRTPIVRWMSQKIDALYTEVTTIPPE